jgi:SpoVK/Ycf46/Vps4 family AAA+-type ATPase
MLKMGLLKEEFKKMVQPRRESGPEPCEIEVNQNFVQWTTTDGKQFFPAARSVDEITPGLYEIKRTPQGMIFFDNVVLSAEGLIKFPETECDKVVSEIETFWEREALFRKFNLSFKRGILLYGPPGSGKTCTIKLAIQNIVRRKGIVIKFGPPGIFSEGLRIFRQIQPDAPVIVLMEDIDSIIEHWCESDVINIIDGVDQIDKVVFLATTNYPEKLGERILNRPSRFDKRFKIGMPNLESRKIYIDKLARDGGLKLDISRWTLDTDGLSIAHIKELFVAVNILGNEYKESLDRLRQMSTPITSQHDGSKAGF